MGSLRERADWFAAILWANPMTEDEMRKHDSFKNTSVTAIINLLERLDMIYYRGSVVFVKKSAAKKLGNTVHVTIKDNCRFCKGKGFNSISSSIDQVNWPCEKCSGTGYKIVRDY